MTLATFRTCILYYVLRKLDASCTAVHASSSLGANLGPIQTLATSSLRKIMHPLDMFNARRRTLE